MPERIPDLESRLALADFEIVRTFYGFGPPSRTESPGRDSDAPREHFFAARPIYTFYSHRGGVGRSMAVANVGALLALEGKKVLLVDWDLDSPGLGRYFQRSSRLSSHLEEAPGVLDLLEACRDGQPVAWKESLIRAEFLETSLDLIPAGNRRRDYSDRVHRLDSGDFYKEARYRSYFRLLRDEWRRAYDLVLVDGRCGDRDIGDVCTALLPDALVLMVTSDIQSVEGVSNLLARIMAAPRNVPVNRGRIRGILVPARDEAHTDYRESLRWKKAYRREFGSLYQGLLPEGITFEDALNIASIPYAAHWSFGERIAVIEKSRETRNPATIGAAYERISNLLASGLNWDSAEGKLPASQFRRVRTELVLERQASETLRGERDQAHRNLAVVLTIVACIMTVMAVWGVISLNSADAGRGRTPSAAGGSHDSLQILRAKERLVRDRLKVHKR